MATLSSSPGGRANLVRAGVNGGIGHLHLGFRPRRPIWLGRRGEEEIAENNLVPGVNRKRSLSGPFQNEQAYSLACMAAEIGAGVMRGPWWRRRYLDAKGGCFRGGYHGGDGSLQLLRQVLGIADSPGLV